MTGEIRGRSPSFVRRSEPGRRNGFALVAALLALLLIAALVTGVFFAATEETNVSAASAERQLTLSAAESAIEMTIAGWSTDSIGPVGVGGTRTASVGGLGAPVVVHITRLDSALYWIVADATGPSRGSRVSRRIGVVVRVPARADRSITIDRISERSWSELF
jgi:type II secretory pathway pseudopilin PulG